MNFTLASDNPNIKVAAILESLRILETNGDLSGGLENALSAKRCATQAVGAAAAGSDGDVDSLYSPSHGAGASWKTRPLTDEDLITAAESVIADLSDQP